ncbi:hypothetical protein [Citrobacter meridianamericanus]|uniref:hypothetical protein n=1 Tax=Citrobacter meridianamericanus TaxID=2894201 RepID=UPI00351D15ED
MLIPEFKKNKMQINVMWTSDVGAFSTPHYTKWLAGVQRRYRSIEYIDSNGIRHKGFIQNNLQSNESFAVYVKEIYGDGFYYCPLEEDGVTNGVYVLIIKDDIIISGTDSVYDIAFFQKLDEEREKSEYSDLVRTKLGIEHFNEISARYKKNIQILQRRRNMQHLFFGTGLFIFAVILYFLTSAIISR